MEDKEDVASDEAVMWQPRDYYDPLPELPYAVILLNKGITKANVGNVRQWWCSAHLRVCVDGATNEFHHLMHQQQESTTASPLVSCPLPDVISGDFDSALPDLLKIYATKGVRIVPTPDQDETDFTKALWVLTGLLEEQQTAVSHILVVAGSDDNRFDHIMGIVATLYKACETMSSPVVVVSGGSLFWVLRAGQHSIRVPGESCHHPSASWCGLVPVGHPATVTTTGLKWNVDHQTLAFGRLVSTSNTYNLPPGGGEVTVTTSAPILWTMGWKAEPAQPSLSLPEHPNMLNGSLDKM
ncbi:thiamin pyrophosphokinase 1-like isoform X2 [Eriocheir sinensis]|nr:thiamin pyrophosphokinase 1-like isoform X2 [Eriocheir sinensis]XP_050734251.1 thiamin pyrophosphokinase 1-like isoform X2 [Eriocheir sinensis]XP_050734252.1 thiamin pyrophosphokinase 1-like isoform X2 [Eriocheir sinensis]